MQICTQQNTKLAPVQYVISGKYKPFIIVSKRNIKQYFNNSITICGIVKTIMIQSINIQTKF